MRAQTYPCKHYVFVDGEQFHDKAREILKDYPEVIVTYLPMNTGANGWVNSSINAIAPFLVKEDIICYLDDDNSYQPNHVESLVEALTDEMHYAYSLRRFCDSDHQFICNDDYESLGKWRWKFEEELCFKIEYKGQEIVSANYVGIPNHIDTNCYAIRRDIACALAQSWYTGIHNDNNVFKTLNNANAQGNCTGLYTVNYYLDYHRRFKNVSTFLKQYISPAEAEESIKNLMRFFGECNIQAHGGKPWAKDNIITNFNDAKNTQAIKFVANFAKTE